MSEALNSFRLRREDDGRVTLEFGSRERPEDGMAPPDPGAGFVAHHRIDLDPTAAWRLAHGLSRTLRRPLASASVPQPASRPRPNPPELQQFTGRSPPEGSPSARGGDALHRRGITPLNLPHEPMAESADWLRAAVREMAPAHFQERSFRIAPGQLQANRFLLSINSRQLPADALQRSWAICQHLGLPATLRPAVEEAFGGAAHLHFGFEGEPGRVICKLYLERQVSGLEAASSRERGEPALQYTAFKWDTATGEHVVSHYHWWAGLSVSGIGERIAAQFEGADPRLVAQARGVLEIASQRLSAERLLYLEVSEAGQPRRSFDLNAYDANLTLRDLQGLLFGMRDVFAVGPSRFQALYDQIKAKRFGHLAGGIHRDGQPFFNVYFGGAFLG